MLLAACSAGGGPPTDVSGTRASEGSECLAEATAPSAAGETTVRLLGAGGPVAMLEVRMTEGGRFALRNDGCQEALVVVREGRVALTATLASSRQRHELGAEAAARLPMGAPAPGELTALEPASVFVVHARTLDREFSADTSLEQATTPPPGCSAGPDGLAPRLAPAGTTGPFAQGDGRLRAYVHLDMPRHGAGLASVGYLDAEATVGVPEHGHDGSAEVLYFESGAGTMRVGAETFPITAGRFVYVPAGVRHGLVPTGTTPLRALQVYTPSGPEQRFRPVR